MSGLNFIFYHFLKYCLTYNLELFNFLQLKIEIELTGKNKHELNNFDLFTSNRPGSSLFVPMVIFVFFNLDHLAEIKDVGFLVFNTLENL